MSEQKIIQGDSLEVLKTLQSESVDSCITSPPYYGLRDYGIEGQIGLEETPEEYTQKIVAVFHEVKRVLKKEGTLWLNLGDSYAGSGRGRDADGFHNEASFENSKQATNRGSVEGRLVNAKSLHKNLIEQKAIGNAWIKPPAGLKQKDLIGIPWRVAFALQADGWYLRQDIIWAKPNPMPESVTDRCTKAHEYIFLLSKSQKYYFNADAIKEESVYDDPRMVDGFVPKSVNGKHANDLQNSAHRKQYKPTEAGGGTSMVGHNGYFKSDGSPIGNVGFRNKRDVWSITVSPFKDAHFATFPEKLVEPMILAGTPPRRCCFGYLLWRGHHRYCCEEV